MNEHTKTPWVAECVAVSSMGPDGVDVYEIVTADGRKRIAEHLSKEDAEHIVRCVNASRSDSAIPGVG